MNNLFGKEYREGKKTARKREYLGGWEGMENVQRRLGGHVIENQPDVEILLPNIFHFQFIDNPVNI